MPNNTTLRPWPYPLSSEKIAAGAVNIEDLAEALQGSFALDMNKYAATEPGTSYPLGESVMRINDTSDMPLGWPYRYGSVVTILSSTAFAWQWFYQYSAPKAFLRQWTSNGWRDWYSIAAAGTPYAQASGDVLLTPPSGGGTVSTVIALPSGRFGDQDVEGKLRIFTAPNSSSTGVETSASWTSSGTPSSFTLYLTRGTATQTGIHWYAIQGSD